MKITEAFSCYVSEYLQIKGASLSARQQYGFAARHLAATIGDININKLTTAHVQKWWQELTKGRCENTARNYLCELRSVLKYCNMRGISCLSSDLVPAPKRRDVAPTFLTENEVSKMIACACNLRGALIISFLYSSGVRLSEFLALNRYDIVENRFTVVGKGGKARLCFIDKRTSQLLTDYLASRTDNELALIVSPKTGHRMSVTVCRYIVEEAARRAKIDKPVTPHTLRHSFATNFLKNNGNMRYLSTLMGHASLQTTAHYAHVVDVDLEAQYQKFHSF